MGSVFGGIPRATVELGDVALEVRDGDFIAFIGLVCYSESEMGFYFAAKIYRLRKCAGKYLQDVKRSEVDVFGESPL